VTDGPITAAVAAFALRMRHEGPGERVRTLARRVVLDQIGLQVGCARLPASVVAHEYVRRTARTGTATVLVHGDRLSAEGASFANAAFGHGQDFDDTCRPAQTHAGAVVVPTAVAVAEEVGANGQATLRAIAAGLEVMVRVAHMVSPVCLRRGQHPMLVAGPFGAAVAAGMLWELDEGQMIHALGIAGSHPGGLVEYSESGGSVKRLHGAIPTTGGIRSAWMARYGLTGPTAVFEGSKGVGRAFAETPELGRLGDDLGARWLLDDLAFKFYNCCYFIHPAIDAARELIRQDDLRPADIAAVRVGTSRQSLTHVGKIVTPRDEVGAQFSMSFTLALVLLGQIPGIDTYSEACLADPEALRLASLVRVEEDSVAEAEYPANWGSIVTIATHDGREMSSRVRDPLGTREHPCSDTDLRTKFLHNVTPVLGRERAAALYERAARLDDLSNMAALTALSLDTELPEEHLARTS